MDEAEDLEWMLTGGERCWANDELILLYRTAKRIHGGQRIALFSFNSHWR